MSWTAKQIMDMRPLIRNNEFRDSGSYPAHERTKEVEAILQTYLTSGVSYADVETEYLAREEKRLRRFIFEQHGQAGLDALDAGNSKNESCTVITIDR